MGCMLFMVANNRLAEEKEEKHLGFTDRCWETCPVKWNLIHLSIPGIHRKVVLVPAI